ncbi:Hypothetical protein D9617_106g078130 [Elsinoe fawcettii]|nr:Hypothetical protein D9617_106g078130 [Elsinoe fawcettii]
MSIVGPYNPNEDEPDYAAVFPRALRCQALMMEVLRLYPPAVHNIRMNTSGKTQIIKTSKHEIRVPNGCAFYTDFVSLQTDPKVWRGLNLPGYTGKTGKDVVETYQDAKDRTQDEYKFRPGRWLVPSPEGGPNLFKPPAGHFVAFSFGPRICPGQKMAQVEFVGVIMTLMRRFRVVANARNGEDWGQTKHRLEEILDDVLSQLTIVMQRVEELDLRWEERGRV